MAKNCNIGYKCGNGCINKSFQCKSKVRKGIMGFLDKITNKIKSLLFPIKNPPLTEETVTGIMKDLQKSEKFDMEVTEVVWDPKGLNLYTYDDNGNRLAYYMSKVSDGTYDVSFMVNGSLNADNQENLPLAEKREISRMIRQMNNAVISNLEDGTVISQSVWNGDGKGESRARIYAKEGFFLKPQKNKDLPYKGRAIINKNKLEPLEFKENTSVLTEDDWFVKIWGD